MHVKFLLKTSINRSETCMMNCLQGINKITKKKIPLPFFFIFLLPSLLFFFYNCLLSQISAGSPTTQARAGHLFPRKISSLIIPDRTSTNEISSSGGVLFDILLTTSFCILIYFLFLFILYIF